MVNKPLKRGAAAGGDLGAKRGTPANRAHFRPEICFNCKIGSIVTHPKKSFWSKRFMGY
jgi:hypothetical protein